MKKSKIISLIAINTLIMGCASTMNTNSNNYSNSMEQYPKKQTQEWCQKNYSSASVSARDRQYSAKFCDPEARQAYIDAKDNEREVK